MDHVLVLLAHHEIMKKKEHNTVVADTAAGAGLCCYRAPSLSVSGGKLTCMMIPFSKP